MAKNDIDWEPQIGVLLCRTVKREEMQGEDNGFALPDQVGKKSDSVGVGEVIKTSNMHPDHVNAWMDMLKKIGEPEKPHPFTDIKPGDFVAWMPYTDQLIEIGMETYSLVGYANIRAVRKVAK